MPRGGLGCFSALNRNQPHQVLHLTCTFVRPTRPPGSNPLQDSPFRDSWSPHPRCWVALLCSVLTTAVVIITNDAREQSGEGGKDKERKGRPILEWEPRDLRKACALHRPLRKRRPGNRYGLHAVALTSSKNSTCGASHSPQDSLESPSVCAGPGVGFSSRGQGHLSPSGVGLH